MRGNQMQTVFLAIGLSIGVTTTLVHAAEPTKAQTELQSAQKDGKPVLVDFSATWCPTCKLQGKALESLSKKGVLDKIKLIKADYDSETELKKVLRVAAQSTLVAFQGEVETGRVTGITDEGAIRSFIEKSFAPVTLKQKLDAMKASGEAKMPADKKAIMESAADELRKSKIAEKAKKQGDVAPPFSLKNVSGTTVSLKEALKKGPVVLTFYRGGWCPYCNAQLKSYQSVLPEFKKRGAQLIALTPETPESAAQTTQKDQIQFEILTDPSNQTGNAYGLVFGVPAELKKLYLGFGIDLEKSQGNPDWQLPIPATYVIDRDGKIAWAFVDIDYRNRAEPSEILKVLDALKK